MPRANMPENLYEQDFFAWANQQAQLLRHGQFVDADIENIAEEIASMGRGEKRELIARLKILLLHMLKWQYQPGSRSASWQGSIKVQRFDLEDHLADNPSLKYLLNETIASAYRKARVEAASESGLSQGTFPQICPWTFGQMMQTDYWPDQA